MAAVLDENETASAYAARLAAFLREQPGHSCSLRAIGSRCKWAVAAGTKGAFMRFLRARPHLFALSADWLVVTLVASPSSRAPVRAVAVFTSDASPLPSYLTADPASPHAPQEQQRLRHQRQGKGPETADAYAKRLAAYLTLHPGGRCSLPLISTDCPWEVALERPGAYAALMLSRPNEFAFEREADGTEYVTLLSPGAYELGVSLLGGPQPGQGLESEPNTVATTVFTLTAAGDAAGAPLRVDSVWVMPPRADCSAALVAGAGAVLQRGGALLLQLTHRPVAAMSALVKVGCVLTAADGTRTSVSSTFALLRCLNATAKDKVLQPTGPYVPKGRSPVAPMVDEDDKGVVPGPPLPNPDRIVGARAPMVKLEQSLIEVLANPHSSGYAMLLRRLGTPLKAANHGQLFRDLLLCEEVQQLVDIRDYDMDAPLARRNDGAFLLEVPGLLEARPSVMKGDCVVVARAVGEQRWEARARSRVVPAMRAPREASPRRVRKRSQGVVHEVQLATLVLRFDPCFDAQVYARGAVYRIRFRLSRSTLLLAHAAVTAAIKLPPALLFPRRQEAVKEDAAVAAVAAAPLPRAPFHRELNERQRQAVRAALLENYEGEPYIIFGPPGTGKTTTVVEYIQQLLHRGPVGVDQGGVNSLLSAFGGMSLGAAKPRPLLVLAAAPSNAACDVLARRLLLQGLAHSSLMRINGYSRELQNVPPELRTCSVSIVDERALQLPVKQELVRVAVITCITAQKMGLCWETMVGREAGVFSHIVIDEAGQATEPDTLAAVSRLLRPGGRLVLAGDPEQLGPVLRSRVAARFGLATSMLERLTKKDPLAPHARRTDGSPTSFACPDGWHPAFVTQLNDNYRSHKALLAVPNALFYDGTLRSCADPARARAFADWEALPAAARAVPGGFPLLFRGVEGLDEREANSPSWFNAIEAATVLDLVRSALDHRRAAVKPKDIGVISPYAKQVQKIRRLLEKYGLGDVDVGSVEQFQGQERTVIILSTVRSSLEHAALDAQQALGFLANPKRFNVAITRARSLLCIVGNPHVLVRDSYWGALLRYAVQNGAYEGCALPDLQADAGAGYASAVGAEAAAAERGQGDGLQTLQAAEEAPGWRRDVQ